MRSDAFCCGAAVLAVAALGCTGNAPPATTPPQLPTLRILVLVDEAPVGVPIDPQVEQLRLARLDGTVFEDYLAGKVGALRSGLRISLDIFGEGAAPLILIVDDVTGGGTGRAVVTAHTPEGPGQAILTYGKRLEVIFRRPEGDVMIRQWRDDVYLVTQLKKQTRLDCATQGRDVPPKAGPDPAGKAMALKSGQVPAVDVLVLYTPAVVNNWPCGSVAGGPPCDEATKRSQIEEHLRTGVDAVNMDLTCSRVRVQVVAPGIMLYDYAEQATIEEDLDELTGSGWSKLAPLRGAAKADLVSLIAWARNQHGIAKLYEHIVSVNNKDALSVVDSNAANRYFTLAHEIAHNIGAGHYPDDRTGAYRVLSRLVLPALQRGTSHDHGEGQCWRRLSIQSILEPRRQVRQSCDRVSGQGQQREDTESERSGGRELPKRQHWRHSPGVSGNVVCATLTEFEAGQSRCFGGIEAQLSYRTLIRETHVDSLSTRDRAVPF